MAYVGVEVGVEVKTGGWVEVGVEVEVEVRVMLGLGVCEGCVVWLGVKVMLAINSCWLVGGRFVTWSSDPPVLTWVASSIGIE